MEIVLEMMSVDNLEEIFEFENENRNFFLKYLPPRPEAYFNLNSFYSLMGELMEEQSQGQCYMFIIRDIKGRMVGRVNLSSVSRGETNKAELGYRIAGMELGKGYGTKAVSLLLEKCQNKFDFDLIEAGTATTNVGSQKILTRNGFIEVSLEKNVMVVNDQLVDGLIFEKRLG